MGITVRAVWPGEYRECVALWCRCFPHLAPQRFARFVSGISEPRLLRACFVDDRVVSTAQIIPRPVIGPGGPLLSGYVTNVATDPEYRRRGLATRCLEDAIRVMCEAKLDLSRLLAAGPGPYQKLGWEPAPFSLIEGRIRSALPHSPPGYHVREAIHTDLLGISAIYAEFNHDRPLAVQRSKEYWRQWLCTLNEGYICPTLVCSVGRMLVGYVQMSLHASLRNCVVEIGARNHDATVLRVLISSAVDLVRQKGAETSLRMAVPHDASVLAAAGAVLDDVRISGPLPWMCRPLRQCLPAAGLDDCTHAPYTWLPDGL